MRSIVLVILILLGTGGGCAATRAMGHRLAMFAEKGLGGRHCGRPMILDTAARRAEDASRERDTAAADGRAGQLERLVDRVSGMMPCGMMGHMLLGPPERGVKP